MADLVALDLPGGATFVRALLRVWDRGDAAFPVDQRFPAPLRRRVIDAMAPATYIDDDGTERTWAKGAEPVVPGDALVVATSGTTGTPKGVVLTHGALAAHARSVHERLGVDRDSDRWLACLPLGHVGGLGVVTRALVDGVPLDVLEGFDADTVAASRKRYGSTLVSLVPTTLDRIDPGPFRWIVLGGAGDASRRPGNVVKTYGLTETGGGVVYDGKALRGTDIRIDRDEVLLRGPTLLRGYRDGTDPRRPDGWLATGDLGAIDGDGRLQVRGRRDDLIVTGGENVWPDAVEQVLATHPRVTEVVVAGRPDPEWGQRVTAFVVPRLRFEPPTLAGLRALAKQHLPPHAAPKELVLLKEIPKTSLGKVSRAALPPPDDPESGSTPSG